jgi:hypothetical protein
VKIRGFEEYGRGRIPRLEDEGSEAREEVEAR